MRCASNGQRRVRSGRGDHVGTEREVRDELAVHDVPLDVVDAGGLERGDLLAELGEVRGQHGRDDLDRAAHRSGNLLRRSGRRPVPIARRRRPTLRCVARPSPSSSWRRRGSGTGRACCRPAPARMRAPQRCDRDPSTTRSRCSRPQSRAACPDLRPIPTCTRKIGANVPLSATFAPNSGLVRVSRPQIRRRPLGVMSAPNCWVVRGVGAWPARPGRGRAYAGRMQLTPERLVAGGDALARDADGRVVFVEGGLPGETVEVEVDTAKKDFARARILEIIEKSPLRDSPSCAHRRAGCGGCDWMHFQPAAQHDAKVEIVRESLRRIGRLDADLVERIVVRGGAVSPFGYRTTIRVVGGPDGTIGFREQGSDAVVGVTSCPVAESKLSRLHGGARGGRWRRAHVADVGRDRCRHGDLGQAVPQVDPRGPVRGAHRRARVVDRARSPATTCACRPARSSSRARRRPSCSSMP